MTMSFPNKSRNYQANARRIRFSGYDGMFEISFFIEVDVLSRVFGGKMTDEGDYLSGFDSGRVAIIKAAQKACSRLKGARDCTLREADFA